MTNELQPVAKAIEELEPAVEAFAAATGLLGPVREIAAWATDLIRYRRAPYQAALLMKAAEQIKAWGLPAQAVEDKLLRIVLEAGPLEDDPKMQERWANLLANASTGQAAVRVAFPAILSELEPMEAAHLECLARLHEVTITRSGGDKPAPMGWIPAGNKDNLIRLRLARATHEIPTRVGTRGPSGFTVIALALTQFGWEFVQACQEPGTV